MSFEYKDVAINVLILCVFFFFLRKFYPFICMNNTVIDCKDGKDRSMDLVMRVAVMLSEL